MKPPRFEYQRPATLDQALSLLAHHGGDAKIIAGGQSLMPMLAFRLLAPKILIDIGRLPALDHIVCGPEGVRLGALVRWRDIERHEELPIAHPLLVAGVAYVAHYQIRNRGTVGGSLAHADPAAEMPGIAVACDADMIVVGPNGRRTVAAADFFIGPLMTTLADDELLIEVRLPAWPPERRWAFEEFALRRGDFALAGIALHYDHDATGRAVDPHVGIIGVGDRPRRLNEAEAAMTGRVIDAEVVARVATAVRDTIEPQSDIHADADYRRALAATLTERALAKAAGVRLPEMA